MDITLQVPLTHVDTWWAKSAETEAITFSAGLPYYTSAP